nr:MAG TPA: hypothetical protein [Bacteriophage sp.]
MWLSHSYQFILILHKAFSVYQSCTNYVPIFIKIRENI